jgi:predicted NAD/FAD-binding protein
MLSDVLRFNRLALRLLSENPVADLTLGEFILENRFSRTFCDSYLLPMSAAIWSAPPDQMLKFPAAPLARFFANHGLLSLRNRPQWRTVTGGASRYVAAMRLARNFNVVTSSPVTKLLRKNDSVHVLAGNIERMFDHAVVAAHADDALRMLADPTAAEREILGAFTYQLNRATLHTDYSLMPRRRAAWASWNYRATAASPVTVTYWMNRLQHLDANAAIFVTLNGDSRIDPAHVIRRFTYSHPLFNSNAIAAQHRHAEISGGRTHYCGAYWGYGFHEDGVKSALAAVCTLETSHESWKAAYTKGTSVTAASPA